MIGLGNSVVKRKIFAPSVPAAPVNVVLPSLTGTGLVGSTITCNKGKWTGVPTPTYEYDFKADGVSVQFGLSNEYVTSGPDIDKVITCEVTATNSQGSASATTSNSITVGTAPTNTVLPTLDVTGNQLIGTVLTATDGTWTGSTPITYQYRWTRNGVAITGATTNTYTLQAADESATIRVQVRGVNSYATSAYVTSDDSVVGGYAPVNTGLPSMSLSGNQLVGTLVTVTDGTWTGTPTITYQYRWLRNGSPIGGATTNSYTLQSADDGATITAEVRGVNNWGTSAYSSSNNSINAGSVPVNAVAPTVTPSGTQSTGTVITANVGTWSGTPTITYAYRWTRNGSPISGATASTYTIQVSDDGTTIRCEVQGSNAFGTSAYVASSNSVSAVNAIAPVNTVAPVISGTAVVGQTLSSTTGTWTGIPTPTYSYQWRRGGVDIGGATSSTYTLVSADAGTNITCRVTATNSAGSVNATSNTLAILATVLDLYPSAAAAYSVRLLRGAHYTSNAIRVRRSNDNAEQDIGFTTAGELNTTALTTFVGSNSGFIVTWYDQSGNANNATQSTPGSQARIVNAGTLDVIGTKPASLFNGTTNNYAIANTISPASGVFTAIAVGRRRATSTNYSVFGDLNTTAASLLLGHLSNRYYLQRNTGYLESPIDNTANHMILIGISASTNQIRRNGVQLTNTLLALTIANNIRTLGAYTQSSPLRLDGSLQEVVIWSFDQTSNISAIESNTNTYYGIY